jgi:hypothetical protein
LFGLDGKPSNFAEGDIARRNTIVNLLVEWKLISVVEDEKIAEPIAPLSQIKILPHKDRNEWELVAKYNIGKKKVS